MFTALLARSSLVLESRKCLTISSGARQKNEMRCVSITTNFIKIQNSLARRDDGINYCTHNQMGGVGSGQVVMYNFSRLQDAHVFLSIHWIAHSAIHIPSSRFARITLLVCCIECPLSTCARGEESRVIGAPTNSTMCMGMKLEAHAMLCRRIRVVMASDLRWHHYNMIRLFLRRFSLRLTQRT